MVMDCLEGGQVGQEVLVAPQVLVLKDQVDLEVVGECQVDRVAPLGLEVVLVVLADAEAGQ